MPSKAKQAPVSSAAPYTLQTLTVRSIHALDDIQPRSYLSDIVVEEYATLYREAEGEEPLPPIDVFQVGGKYYVSDGFHRLEAAKLAKRKALPCQVYTGSQQEAMRHGAFANLKRGLAYSHDDRQRILERLLQDPDVSQRSDRALARDLGLSHVTVGRARHRLAAEATLAAQWQAVPVTQTKEEARRQEQIAAFLDVEPAVVAKYDKIITPLDKDRIIPWVARRMTDSSEPEAQAKAGVRAHLQKVVREREQERAWRRKHRTPKPTPAEEAAREAERERRERENYLMDRTKAFVGVRDGRQYMFKLEKGYTLLDMVEALSPDSVQELPDLLSQAEAVIQTLRDALTAPEQQDVPYGEPLSAG